MRSMVLCLSNSALSMLAVISISMGVPHVDAQVRSSEGRPSVSNIVDDVSKDPDADSRYIKTKKLAILLHKDSTYVSKEDALAIATLLKDKNDLVRHWAGLALGQIGENAKVAIPALRIALGEVECIRADHNSRFGISFALRRLGAPPQPANCIPGKDYSLRPANPLKRQ